MTRKEAIRIATGLRTDFKCESDTMVDFCNTVIKALERKPNTDRVEYGTDGNTYRLTISNGKELEQEPIDVLDKIRAEIKALTDGVEPEYIWNVDVLAIIDKYKAESEDK